MYNIYVCIINTYMYHMCAMTQSAGILVEKHFSLNVAHMFTCMFAVHANMCAYVNFGCVCVRARMRAGSLYHTSGPGRTLYRYLYTFIHTHIYIYTCTYLSMYIHIYIYTHTHLYRARAHSNKRASIRNAMFFRLRLSWARASLRCVR